PDLIAVEVALKGLLDVIESLKSACRRELVIIAAEGDFAIGLRSGGLDLAQLVLAAERLDGLVEDGFRVWIIRRSDMNADQQGRRQRSTEEPRHQVTSWLESRDGKRLQPLCRVRKQLSRTFYGSLSRLS